MRKSLLFSAVFVLIAAFFFAYPSTTNATCQECFGGADCSSTEHCSGGCCAPNVTPAPTLPGEPPCFPAGTKILQSDHSTKNIEDMKPGDEILSQDETGKQSTSTVQKLLKPISNNICEIRYTDGEELKVTNGHPLYTQNGWKAIDPIAAAKEDPGVPVSRLLIGDFMTKANGTWPQVSSISCKSESIQTYNLVVDNTHTYFAGGFLAHNKGTCWGCGDPVTNGVPPVDSTTWTTTSPTSAIISWTTDGGNYQCGHNRGFKIWIGTNQNLVNNYCADSPTTDNPTGPAPGGIGGGGNGADIVTAATAGRVGTGGGGGGGGAPGGSGRVYIRYNKNSGLHVAGDGCYIGGAFCGTPQAGETVTTFGDYIIHSYSLNANFSVTAGTAPVDLFIVGAGGAGGSGIGGGGGGGGVVYATNRTVTAGVYSIVVGAAGTNIGVTWEWNCDGDKCHWLRTGTGQGGSGGNSSFGSASFGTLTAIGGGGGGGSGLICAPGFAVCYWMDNSGVSGGSGGGAAAANLGGVLGGSGTPGQGHNGASSVADLPNANGSGGGGGASVDGHTSAINVGGSGGDGIGNSITGTAKYFSGGGGGATNTNLPIGCNWIRTISNTLARSFDTSSTVTGYPAITLSPSTVYYAKVASLGVEQETMGTIYCSITGTSNPGISSCSVTANPSTIDVGNSSQLSTTINGSASVSKVVYTANPTYFSFSPTNGTSTASPYNVALNALKGTYTSPGVNPGQGVTSNVYLTSNPTVIATSCSTNVVVNNPAAAAAWWQVKDSDVQSNSNITSLVPPSYFFGLAGSGGYPGVPAYYGNVDFGGGTPSQIGWLAQSPWNNPKVFDYSFFFNLIPANIVQNNVLSISSDNLTGATADANGYEWYKYDGASHGNLPLTISNAINVGSRKIILLVANSNLNISASISGITKGSGFFMAIVNGNINIDPSVGGAAGSDLEGLYVADNAVNTGTNGAIDATLKIRGSIVGYGGVNLQRNVGAAESTTTPSELLEYAPDQILLFPPALGYRRINWKEVAP